MTRQGAIAGVDMGTTSIKVVVFDLEGREVSRKSSEQLELLHDDTGAAEQNPEAVYQACTEALVGAAEQALAKGYEIQAVGMSAAMHSLIAVAEDGTPLTNALTWMDTRASEDAEQLWSSEIGKQIYARTGTPIHPMAPLPKLLWLRRERADVFQGAAKFVSLKEYVWFRWFGVWEIDASMASATGLYAIAERDWDGEALELTGLTRNRFSKLVSTTFVRTGCTDESLRQAGISSEVPFNIGASDGVLANLGVGSVSTDRMAMTVGTSCAVRVGTTQPVTDPGSRCFCYVLDEERFIVGGPSNSGGIVLDWLYHQVLSDGPEKNLGEALSDAADADCGDLICLPYVAGERAPLWNPHARASLIGLQLHHTRNHVLRAAVEGVIYNAYWIASRLFDEIGRPSVLVASGKLLDVEWVRSLLADVFGIPVEHKTDADASVVGAVMLAAKSSNIETAVQHGEAAVATMLHPNRDRHQAHQKKFAQFQNMCGAVLNASHLVQS